ncbi:hypothetical protein A6R68_23436 [Neotoma lepida]|uniref:Uncharacterized protein n=1 Tax=Neotoma lepida TaxID=56216 RepID=A0A1A6HWF7_NEOLE|nr:hypothetical protein A6R68_23436 [Neotoma lepida]
MVAVKKMKKSLGLQLVVRGGKYVLGSKQTLRLTRQGQ